MTDNVIITTFLPSNLFTNDKNFGCVYKNCTHCTCSEITRKQNIQLCVLRAYVRQKILFDGQLIYVLSPDKGTQIGYY